jgi:hypothetical protein
VLVLWSITYMKYISLCLICRVTLHSSLYR